MQLRHITLHRYEAPLKLPFVTALRRVDRLESRIVRIETVDGVTGEGETVPTPPITGETFATIQSGFKDLRDALMRADAPSFENYLRIVQASNAKSPTKAAFEGALFAIAAQQAGMPLWRFLQYRYGLPLPDRSALTSDITVSVGDIPSTLQAARQAVARGYTTLKVKLDGNVDAQIKRIRTLHHTFPHVALRLDANQAFDVDGCLRLLRALEKDGIVCECIEQPLPAEDIDGMAFIKKHTKTPMLADESVFSYDDAKALLERNAADILNIKLAKTGGITEAARIAKLCRKHGIQAMMGCMLEGPVALSTAAHTALAFHRTIKLIDLDAVDLLDDPPYKGDVVFQGSKIVLPVD